MTGLSRDVFKWLQSLDLDCQIKNPKWDLSNGYLVAEILTRYFPQQIMIHSFYKGASFAVKRKNWFVLKNFFLKHELDIDMEVIDGTIHCREGSAVKLLETMYETLTSRRLKRVLPIFDTITPYYLYQRRLPAHQRTTASRAVKSNLRLTEILAEEGSLDCTQRTDWLGGRSVLRAQTVINDHLEHRRMERFSDPNRFGMKPTLGDCCVRSRGPLRRLCHVPSHFSGDAEKSSELYWKEIWTKRPYEFREEQR